MLSKNAFYQFARMLFHHTLYQCTKFVITGRLLNFPMKCVKPFPVPGGFPSSWEPVLKYLSILQDLLTLTTRVEMRMLVFRFLCVKISQNFVFSFDEFLTNLRKFSFQKFNCFAKFVLKYLCYQPLLWLGVHGFQLNYLKHLSHPIQLFGPPTHKQGLYTV